MKTNSARQRYRIIITFILIMLTVVSAFPLSAAADDDKEYRVDNAEFTVLLEENGSARIMESWTVTYERGSFTRFSKDIYNPANQLEFIKELKIGKGFINGEDAVFQKTEDRVDGHYSIVTNADGFTINWYQSAQNETVKYEIIYGMDNAVKLDENNRAEFCYRFIGENFPKPVANVKTTIFLPKTDATVKFTVSDGKGASKGTEVDFSTVEHSGMYKIRLDMSPGIFGTLQRIADVQLPKSSTRSSKNNTAAVLVVVGVIGLFVLGLLFSVIKMIAVRIMIKKDPDRFRNVADRLDSCDMPFAWYLLKPFVPGATSLRCAPLFFAELFDLCNKGMLTVTSDGLRINPPYPGNTWDTMQSSMDKSFIDLLCKYFTVAYKNEGRMIYFESIRSRLLSNSSDHALYLEMREWKSEYDSKIKNSPLYNKIESGGSMKAIRKDLRFWLNNGQFAHFDIDPYDCLSLLSRTGHIDSFTVLAMMSSKKTSHYSTGENDMRDFVQYVDGCLYSNNYGSSGSSGGGCASCSSCSSCSGCGGGGAD